MCDCAICISRKLGRLTPVRNASGLVEILGTYLGGLAIFWAVGATIWRKAQLLFANFRSFIIKKMKIIKHVQHWRHVSLPV